MHLIEGSKRFATSVLRADREVLEHRWQLQNVPFETKLAKANIASRVVISRRCKLDILRVLVALEADLSIFVETADDIVKVIEVFRLGEICCNTLNIWESSRKEDVH